MSESKAVLYYFPGRGRAEIVRFTMAATRVEWDTVNLTENQQLADLKASGKLLFGQPPLIEFEGKNIVQSGAASRFFAKRGNLLGDNEDECLKIDVLYEGARDFVNSFMTYGFAGWDDYLVRAKTSLSKFLPIFENALVTNGSNGFLVGNRLSLADLALLEDVLLIEEYYGSEEFNDYPQLQNFLSTMRSNTEISTYLNGPLRPKKNDENYCSTVRRVLGF